MAMVESDRFKREQKVNVLKKSISVIDDNYAPSPEMYEEQKKTIEMINTDLLGLINGSFVMNTKTTHYQYTSYTTDDSAYTYTMFNQLCLAWIESLQNIIKVITDKSQTTYLFKMINEHYFYVYMHVAVTKENMQLYSVKVGQTDSIIKQLDPSYLTQNNVILRKIRITEIGLKKFSALWHKIFQKIL